MARAVQNLSPLYRDKLVVAIQSYSRWAGVLRKSVESALKKLRLEYADILILGKFDGPLSQQMMEEALRIKESGRTRHVIVSAHRRTVFREHLARGMFDAIMVRYSAAHTGAEKDVFPLLPLNDRPGVVCYTATRWGTLLQGTPGEQKPSASDCYRFVLSNPAVDLCLCGPKNRAELLEAFQTLESSPMNEEELAWMRRVGAVIYQRKHHNFILRKLIFD